MDVTWDWLRLRSVVVPAWFTEGKPTQGQINMALVLLSKVLQILFGNLSVDALRQGPLDVLFFQKVSSACESALAGRKTRPTVTRTVRILRRILLQLNVPAPIVRAFELPPLPRKWDVVLGRKYGSFASSHPVRHMLECWLQKIRQHTPTRSERTLRNMLFFYLGLAFPRLGFALEDFLDVPAVRPRFLCLEKERLLYACGDSRGPNLLRNLRWLTFFVSRIVEVELDWRDVRLPPPSRTCAIDDGDPHRIAKPDLERLYEAAKASSAEDELFFLLLLTTGMRIGGYANLETRWVAEVLDGRWCAKEQGKTIEKGAHIFHFKLHPRVRALLAEWLNKERGFCASPFLFPGKFGGRRSTDYFRKRFRRLCQRAGLHGRQFHPHSLRHCYSHILLELGNTAETVSKLIGHACVTTTIKHYLKESAAEVCERAIVPWMPRSKPADPLEPVPDFLIPATHKRRLAGMRDTIALLETFKRAKGSSPQG